MSYEIRNVNGAAVVSLTGDVDLQTSPVVRQKLLESLDGHSRVVVDLSAGVLLTGDLVSDVPVLASGEVLAGVDVAAGRMPPDLRSGDQVDVIVVASDPAGGGTARSLDGPAEVWSVTAHDDGTGSVVTLGVPLAEAVDLAAASTVDLVRLGAAG